MERNTNTIYIIRFIAALVVILFHYSPITLGQHIAFIIKNGGEAVNLFFFISGFVLTISNNSYFKGNDPFPKKAFYVKRFARIYPLYLLGILILLIFHFLIKRIDTPTVVYRMPFEIAGIQKWFYSGSFNYPGWSISCEFFFYLLFPIIAKYARCDSLRFTWLVWIYFFIAMLATNFLSTLVTYEMPFVLSKLLSALYLNPLLLISIFLFGVLAGKCFIENKINAFKNSTFNLLAFVLASAVVMLIKYYTQNGWGFLRGGILAPVYFILIITVTSLKKKESKFFSNRLFIFLGEISYGMYILQYPVYVFFTYYLTPITTGLDLIIYCLMLICICSITFLFVEKPLKTLITNYWLQRALNNG
jgi:peptidoglycan/LPS O-acetylase OafA/YrhL